MANQSAIPTAPVLAFNNLEETEALAKAVLPSIAYDYYSEGADGGVTVVENRAAFSRVRLLPRMLRDVSRLTTVTEVLGLNMAFPVMVAPMAMHGLGHPDREMATARAAKAAGIPFVFSTMATSSLEEIAQQSHPCAIFQLYVISNRDVVRQWVQKAEALGFKALMITVDAPRLGRREATDRNKFSLPMGLELKNLALLTSDTMARSSTQGSGLENTFKKYVDASLTWEILPWLRTVTKLPLILKGILSPEDAKLAVKYGADAIVISNHGGRQLDGVPSALEMLPACVAAVNGAIPVLVDGGIRRGTDVLKALAMGAKAVLLGRPVLYGLALGGQAGVERVLMLLRQELELAMCLSGAASIKEIDGALLLPEGGGAALAAGACGKGGSCGAGKGCATCGGGSACACGARSKL